MTDLSLMDPVKIEPTKLAQWRALLQDAIPLLPKGSTTRFQATVMHDEIDDLIEDEDEPEDDGHAEREAEAFEEEDCDGVQD